MKPKREKRKLEREKKLGPDRKISVYTVDKFTLECGHVVLNPKIQKTTLMRPSKFYRCIECKTERDKIK